MKKTEQPGQFWVRVRWIIYVVVLLGGVDTFWHKATGGPPLIDERFWKWLFAVFVYAYAMQFVEITNARLRDLSDRVELLEESPRVEHLVKATDTVIGNLRESTDAVIGDLNDRVERLEEELEERNWTKAGSQANEM